MFSKTFSASLQGIGATLIEVEISVNQGLRSFSIVGLADKSIAEAKERVASAIKILGFHLLFLKQKRWWLIYPQRI